MPVPCLSILYFIDLPAVPYAPRVAFCALCGDIAGVGIFLRGALKLPQVVYVIRHVVVLLLSVIQLAMLARAVLSWFPMQRNKYTDLLDTVTEPFISPIRLLFYKMNWFQRLPIDVSFLVSYMLISAVIMMLS